eukprot:jgi/Chrzof1/9967/Cz04g22080.t1
MIAKTRFLRIAASRTAYERALAEAGRLHRVACFSSFKPFAAAPKEADGSSEDTVEVSFIDPKTVLDYKEWKGQGPLEDQKKSKVLTTLTVPLRFLPALSQGHHELGDMDDPMNSWYFGKHADIFQYQFVGSHVTMAGYSSIIKSDHLKEIYSGQKADLPSWEQFKKQFSKGKMKFPCKNPPLLFAGYMVDTSEVAVYKLVEQQQIVGVMISSESMG